MRARGEKLLVEILRNSGNKSRTKAQPVVRKGETDFLYCPSAPATTKTVTIEGIRARKTVFETRRKTIYSERRWRRFLSRTPRDATNGRNNCSKLKLHPLHALCRDENAPRRSLFFTTFRSSFSPLQASCRNCRRRRRLLLRGTSAPQGTDAGNITSSSPFYGYCYAASAPYFYAPCLCELLYASGVYTRRIYPYNVD